MPPKPPAYKFLGVFDPITNNPGALWGFILLSLGICALLLFALTLTPSKLRKPLIVAVTFLGGLFYTVEFFWPTTIGTEKGSVAENFLTAYLKPVGNISEVLQAFALGIGVVSLVTLHLRQIARRRADSGFSVVLLGALIAMLSTGILKEYYKGSAWETANTLLYNGAFSNLNSAMFSIVAFYIVSAAYRAFRVRSVEATILLVSAAIVMIGQVTIGQALTNGIPKDDLFMSNFRIENIANWILTRVNSPAQLAINLGLGVGALATALRIWLNLERGSYFEKEL